ncbi:N-acyl homoserine lactonase family protein [Rhodococcus aerolatus]
MSAGVRRVVPLTLGWEDLPLAVSLEGADPAARVVEPVPGVLLECDGGWLLLDTGFNTAWLRDPWLAARYHGAPDHRAILPGPGEPVEEGLATVGLALDDVVAVGLSHLHLDHAGGLKLFAGRVPVHVQRDELAFVLDEPVQAEQHGLYRADVDDPRVDWRLADGDVEIAPGVTALATPGHTPGHQSFLVDLDASVGGGGLVLAFDAADLTANVTDEVSVGGRVRATPQDCVEQVRRLKAIAAERGYPVVPGHDPHAWPALTEALDVRFGTVRSAWPS